MAIQTIAAVFDRYEDAANAVSKLEAAGVGNSDISIVSNDATQRGRYGETNGTNGTNGTDTAQAASTGAGAGASVGTAVGAGAGLLAGLGMLAVPGLGPVVAAGWLVATLVGAGAGAAAGGLLGSLTGAGVSETDAHSYAEAVKRGGTLVTVRASDTNRDQVVRILDTDGTVDLGERESTWRSQGWDGRYADDSGMNGAGVASAGERPRYGAADAVPGVTTPGIGERPRVRSYPQ
jgi:hypothetical protein